MATPLDPLVVNPRPNAPGLTIWTLNTCTLKAQDLIPLAQSFEDTSAWDVLCPQEGTATIPEGIHTDAGFWILTGHKSQVGSPQLILNNRVGSRLRRTKLHTHYVMAEVAMVPPVILFSLYLPPHAAHSVDSFEETLESFTKDLGSLHHSSPGSFVLGGGDCNVQPIPTQDLVGSFVGTLDRACDQERQGQLTALLAGMGMKLPTTFADTGPTRTPWPGQKQQPSKIDFIFCSSKLTTKLHTDDLPTPCTSTDHKPVGLTAHAPYASRKERRRQFEQLLGRQHNQNNIHTRWAPANEFKFAQRIRSLHFDTLSEVADKLTTIAKEENACANAHSKQKSRLLEGVRRSTDPLIKKAYTIHLQAFRREKRVGQEQRRLMDSAKGKDWHFSRQAKLPARAAVPQQLDGQEDRGQWGSVLHAYLQNLYHADDKRL